MTQQSIMLYNAAVKIAEQRWPMGQAIAAAAITDKGTVLTSVWVDAACDAACLCAETGTIAEAHKLNEKIVEIICVSREMENEPFIILPACGICQERLAFFGPDLLIAVSKENEQTILTKTLKQLRPHYWRKDYSFH